MEDLRRVLRDRALALPSARIIRDRSNPFETLSDVEFYNRFRFTRRGFFRVLDTMNGMENNKHGPSPLTVAHRLAIALHVLAGNPFQQTVGDLFGVSQSTISRCLEEITDYFSANVGEYVKWHTKDEAKAMATRVSAKYKLPGVVGAIDGTHIRIIAPRSNEFQFVNRKGYHSLNVAVIVDDQYRILWFAANWPGSTHDSKAFRDSELHRKFASGELWGRLVGDSAYRAESYMLKIFAGNNLTPQQQRYNNAVCAFRVTVEQTFGQIKRVFHILHSELRYDPVRSSRIVATAICLRNIQLKLHEPPVDPAEEGEEEDEELEEEEEDHDLPQKKGSATMEAIASAYF